MQGLADGYFVLPYTIGDYLAKLGWEDKISTDDAAFKTAEGAVNDRLKQFLSINGKRSADSFHKELGKIMWDKCGMARNKAGLTEAIKKIPELREEFWKNLKVPGSGQDLNQELEKAGRVADFLEFGELMCRDALHREESCGGHFREEHQTPEGEAKRDDDNFTYVGAWEYAGDKSEPKLHKEPLEYENVKLTQRSYK